MSRLDEIRTREQVARTATYRRKDADVMDVLRDALNDRSYLLDLVERAGSLLSDDAGGALWDQHREKWLTDAGFGEDNA